MTEEPNALAVAAASLDEALLGGPRRYTRLEMSELTGVPPEFGRRLWRALGFPDVADDETWYTDGDLAALKLLRDLIASGVIDSDLAVTNARALAQQLARLADWQVGIFVDRFLRIQQPGGEIDPGMVGTVIEHLVPTVQELVVFVWRRQLASAGGRLLGSADSELTDDTLAVGFADLVGYTRLTRGLDEVELSALIESFESRASDLVASAGGRIVKTIGDEVMLAADDVVTATEIGLQLAETLRDAEGQEVRVGIAWGSVLARLGDLYGTTVNLASRLTSIARPGSVLVDEAAAAQLEDHGGYFVKPIPRHRLRGLGFVDAFVVRRSRSSTRTTEVD